jgi:Fur family ferric uptake transcriptional regulator
MNSKELIRSKSLKFTPAREALLEIFQKSAKPISYEDIKDKISMDKATFYRNVNAFENIGLLQSFESNDKKRYYEFRGPLHGHLICTKCNSIECLHDIPQELLNDSDIEGITIHSKCKKCKKEK